MPILSITRAKSKTREGKWFTFMVKAIAVLQGDVYLIPSEEDRAKSGDFRYTSKPIPLSDCKVLNFQPKTIMKDNQS